MKDVVAGRRRRARGFTLLEVLLALAILVGCLAVLGELNEQGLGGARRAAALARAQIYCESKLGEILAGITPATSIGSASYEVDPAWNYAITAEPTVDSAVLLVRVSFVENVPPEKRPTEFSLVRRLRDPLLLSTTTTDGSTSTTSTGGSP